MLARIEALRVESQEQGLDDATRCYRCLEPSQYVDSCESQFGQDIWLYTNFFRCLSRPGVYIDVGAHKPMALSTTWLLDRCLGWKKGLCVEANHGYAQHLSRLRSCEVESAAMSISEGSAVLDNGGASGALLTNSSEGATVQRTTLASTLLRRGWLDEAGTGELVVDFMSVDVESHELEVLFGTPWDRLFIRFILVENVLHTEDVFEFLVDKGYVKIFTLAVDDLYARVGPTLERNSQLNYYRSSAAQMRRDDLHVSTYDHKALFAGWEHVMRHVEASQAIPSE